jgi:hypothetical protein
VNWVIFPAVILSEVIMKEPRSILAFPYGDMDASSTWKSWSPAAGFLIELIVNEKSVFGGKVSDKKPNAVNVRLSLLV